MKKALAVSAHANYEQKLKGNKANTCIGNFLQVFYCNYKINLFNIMFDNICIKQFFVEISHHQRFNLEFFEIGHCTRSYSWRLLPRHLL